MNEATVAQQPIQGWKRALGIVGLVAHLAVGYVYLTAGLVIPGFWLLGFWLAWAVFLAIAIWLLRRRPLWVLVVPVVALGFLIGGATLGERLLGWTA